MAIDSTANLLFNIGANSDDAESNIARFRNVMGKDLDDLGAEFQGWSDKVLGNLTTVAGAMTAASAALAAGVVAVAAVAVDAGEKYAQYAEQIERGSVRTGIAAEGMSKIHYAAQTLGVDYDRLVLGLGFFANSIVKANEGSAQQAEAFARLGLTQKDLAAGEQNMMPLLEKVMDRFAGMSSQVEKAAVARDLFSRGGQTLIQFLQQGSAGLEEFSKRAEELGLVLTEKDLVAAKEFKIALQELKAEQQAIDLEVGQKTLPMMLSWKVALISLFDTIRSGGAGGNVQTFVASWVGEIQAAYERIQGMAAAAMNQGGQDTLLPPPEKTKEAATEFSKISDLMEQIRMRTAGTGDEVTRAVAEIQHLQTESDKAVQKFIELKNEGKLSADAIAKESAAMANLPASLIDLGAALAKEITDKRNQAILAAGDELQSKLNGQQEKTWQTELAGWETEIARLRDHLTQKKLLTQENADLLAAVEAAGQEKIHRNQQQAFDQELVGLQQNMASVISAHMTTAERLQFSYEQDLQKFDEVQEGKVLATARGEAQQDAIRQQFALNRQALTDRYKSELQALANSQGWQAVLGGEFGRLLKNDEVAWREWSESADQAMSMVKLSDVAMTEELQQGFQSFGRAMAQNIAQAIIYQKSIGDAMRSAAASALESIASESLVQAIFSGAIGFLRLAQHDYSAASAAFEAAALFGSVGAVAAVAGRAIAPPQNSSSGTAAGSGASSSSSTSSAQSASNAQQGGVHIYIQSPVIGGAGIEELCSMINDAVNYRDVRLVATQTKQATRVTV